MPSDASAQKRTAEVQGSSECHPASARATMTSLYPRQARPRSPRRQPPARQPRTRAPRRDEPWASPRPGWTRVGRHHHPGPAAEFSRITRARLPVFCELIDLLQQSDVHIAACIVDRDNGTDPFAVDEPQWLAHARVTAKLLVGIINKRELAGVLLDHISTPRGCAFDDSARHDEHQDASNVAGVSGLRGLNEQRRPPTRRHRGGSRRSPVRSGRPCQQPDIPQGQDRLTTGCRV